MDQEGTKGKKKGRHGQNLLSAAFVRTAKGPAFYADGNGLYLKVDASGARRWVQRIVIQGSRRDMAVGPVSLVPLAEARGIAYDNKRMVRSGIDPRQAKKKAEAVLSFRDAAQKVYELHRPKWRNEKHAAQFLSTLETYSFPRMGNLRVSDISSADILAVMQPIWLEKPETARKLLQRISRILKWTIAQGWRTDNPALAISEALPKQDRSNQQHRKSLPYYQVAGCLGAVQNSRAYPLSKLAFECLVLTASRSGEVRLAVWSEIDLEKAVWSIPAERMKMSRDHSIPLSPRMMDVLGDARSFSDGSDLVFPSNRHGKPISDATLLKLVKAHGFDCHIHGFRASFRTWVQEQTSTPYEVAEAALAHVKGDKTVEAYARSNLFERRRKLMNEWAAYLSGNNEAAA